MQKRTIAALSVAAATLVAVPTIAMAQETTDDTTPTHRRGGEKIETVAGLLGIEEADLRVALRDGATVAELAEAAGVDVDAIADARVAQAEEHLADHVADGRLTEEEAASRLAELEEHVDAFLAGDATFGDKAFGDRGFGHRGGGHFGMDLSAITDLLGLEPTELREALAAGSTIAQLAEANGSSADEVIAAAVAEVEARLDEAVADEHLTAEQAADMLAIATDKITDLVNGNHPEFNRFGGEDFRRQLGADMDAIIDLLGMEPLELRQALAEGATIAELAEANGSSADEVIAASVAAAEARLADAVADGLLTEDQAADMLSLATDKITEMVNGEFSFGGFDGFRQGHGRHGQLGWQTTDA